MPVKKKSPKSLKIAVPGKKKASGKWRSVEYVAVGADVSMSTISLAGLAKTKDGKLRHGAVSIRWDKDYDYFRRMKEAAKAHDAMLELFKALKVMPELTDVYIAAEEPVPIGFFQRASKGQASGQAGAYLKQQVQISGSFLGGLLRWGWEQIYEIQANQWRKLVADDLAEHHGIDFTTYKPKWASEIVLPLNLPSEIKVKGDSVGKYRAQQWMRTLHSKWDKGWEDIVGTSKGQRLRGDSKAQGLQCNDIYEAFAMAEFMRREIKRGSPN